LTSIPQQPIGKKNAILIFEDGVYLLDSPFAVLTVLLSCCVQCYPMVFSDVSQHLVTKPQRDFGSLRWSLDKKPSNPQYSIAAKGYWHVAAAHQKANASSFVSNSM
jgi:hypothetical protein